MQGNYFSISNSIFDYELSKSEFYVYSYLSKCAGKDRKCFPSRNTIGKHCNNMSLATVDKSIASLIDKGLIIKTARYSVDTSKHNQNSNLYEILKI